MNSPIVIGKIGTVFGVKGFLKIHSFTDPIDKIDDYLPWQIKLKGKWKPLIINELKKTS